MLLLLLLSSDTAYQAQDCSVVLHVVESTDLIDKLDILYTNADGLINKRQELRVLINSLQDKPDVIAITEIKPKNISVSYTHLTLPTIYSV